MRTGKWECVGSCRLSSTLVSWSEVCDSDPPPLSRFHFAKSRKKRKKRKEQTEVPAASVFITSIHKSIASHYHSDVEAFSPLTGGRVPFTAFRLSTFLQTASPFHCLLCLPLFILSYLSPACLSPFTPLRTKETQRFFGLEVGVSEAVIVFGAATKGQLSTTDGFGDNQIAAWRNKRDLRLQSELTTGKR